MKTAKDYIIITALTAAALACLALAAACRGMTALCEICRTYAEITVHLAARIRAAWDLLPLVAAALLPLVVPVAACLVDALDRVRNRPAPSLMGGVARAWTFRRQVLAECR